MEVSVGDIAMPGDTVRDEGETDNIILGPGLRRDGRTMIVCKTGILKKRSKPIVYYVDCYQKRYVPVRGETVVGIVTQKLGDIYKVDIGASDQASLSYLAFEGSTKRERPDIQIGDLVFARLLTASKDMESELVCVNSLGKANQLGILSSEGMLFNCSLNLARKLLSQSCTLLESLGKNVPHELAIGMNGRIWIKANSVDDTLAVAHEIYAAEFVPILPDNMMDNLTIS